VKILGPTIASETASIQHDGTHDGCSISIVWTLIILIPEDCFLGHDNHLKGMINQPFQIVAKNAIQIAFLVLANRAVTVVKVPATLAEENVLDTFVERSVPATEGMAELGEFLISIVLCIQ
jgi:hypothetical protein